MSTDRPVVGITMGDPGGIGPEIVVESYETVFEETRIVVLGDTDVLRNAIQVRSVDLGVNPVDRVEDAVDEDGVLDVLDFGNVESHTFGAVRAEYGRASIEYVERAIELALEDKVDAMANAPINKKAMNMAGSEYTGHTPLLTERTGTGPVPPS